MLLIIICCSACFFVGFRHSGVNNVLLQHLLGPEPKWLWPLSRKCFESLNVRTAFGNLWIHYDHASNCKKCSRKRLIGTRAPVLAENNYLVHVNICGRNPEILAGGIPKFCRSPRSLAAGTRCISSCTSSWSFFRLHLCFSNFYSNF